MNRYTAFFATVLMFFCCLAPAHAVVWKELSSDHFIIKFTQDEKFAKGVLDRAEQYYRSIASDIGYPRYSEFWTWDKRAKIYIYPDKASFLKATGQPGWSEGMADYGNKQIISYAWSRGFEDSLLPHEMAHLIFRDFVGFRGEIPLWLDEGVAQWAEVGKRAYIKDMSRQLYIEDALLSLKDMMRLDIRRITAEDRVYIRGNRTKEDDPGVLFLSGESLINTYYLQSVSLVGFLIERYGSERFARFCRELRDGKSMDEALSYTYPDSMRSLAELEKNWRQYLQALQ